MTRQRRIKLPANLMKKFTKAVQGYGNTKALATDTGISYYVVNQIKYSGVATAENIAKLESQF
jgi:hypothetical protein